MQVAKQVVFPGRPPSPVPRLQQGLSGQPGRGVVSGRGGGLALGGQKRGHDGRYALPPMAAAHHGYYTDHGRQHLVSPPSGGGYDPAYPGYGQPGLWGAAAGQPGAEEMLDMVVNAVARIDDGGVVKKRKKDEVDNNSVEEPLVPVVLKGLDGDDGSPKSVGRFGQSCGHLRGPRWSFGTISPQWFTLSRKALMPISSASTQLFMK